MKDGGAFNFVFYTLWGSLLLAPPAAFFSARYARQHNTRYLKPIFNSVCTFFCATLGCLLFDIQFGSVEVNAVVLAALYFSFFFIVGCISKSKLWYLKTPALVSGATIAGVGYLLGTVGLLALVFFVGDSIPVHSAMAGPNLRCSVTLYGNATTSSGGYVVQLQRPLLLPYVMIRVYEQRFEQSQSQLVSPQEVCTLAVAQYVS